MGDLWKLERDRCRHLGGLVHQAREAEQLTLQQLGAIVGCSTPSLSRIEHGHTVPAAGVAERLTEWVLNRLQTAESDDGGSARWTDPDQSHHAVRAILGRLQGPALDAARDLTDELGRFDDGDLTDRVSRYTMRPEQRNAVARARGRLERAGRLVRVGRLPRPDRVQATYHFTTKG